MSLTKKIIYFLNKIDKRIELGEHKYVSVDALVPICYRVSVNSSPPGQNGLHFANDIFH